jgi:hypothetical protein
LKKMPANAPLSNETGIRFGFFSGDVLIVLAILSVEGHGRDGVTKSGKVLHFVTHPIVKSDAAIARAVRTYPPVPLIHAVQFEGEQQPYWLRIDDYAQRYGEPIELPVGKRDANGNHVGKVDQCKGYPIVLFKPLSYMPSFVSSSVLRDFFEG